MEGIGWLAACWQFPGGVGTHMVSIGKQVPLQLHHHCMCFLSWAHMGTIGKQVPAHGCWCRRAVLVVSIDGDDKFVHKIDKIYQKNSICLLCTAGCIIHKFHFRVLHNYYIQQIEQKEGKKKIWWEQGWPLPCVNSAW